MGADVLETQGARASATMIFTMLNRINRSLYVKGQISKRRTIIKKLFLMNRINLINMWYVDKVLFVTKMVLEMGYEMAYLTLPFENGCLLLPLSYTCSKHWSEVSCTDMIFNLLTHAKRTYMHLSSQYLPIQRQSEWHIVVYFLNYSIQITSFPTTINKTMHKNVYFPWLEIPECCLGTHQHIPRHSCVVAPCVSVCHD